MFNSYEFSYAGESSRMYGLMIYDLDNKGQDDVTFATKANIVETRTINRIQPIHFGVNYHKTPLEFKLVFGSEKPLDRYTFERISFWLLGSQQYNWLTIDQPDLDHVQFKCIISSLTPISVGWLPVAFEATITCDCPYAYGHPFEETYDISGTTSVTFWNESSMREYFKPMLEYTPNAGVTEIKIVNKTDNNREFVLTDLPADGLVITIDNSNGIISEPIYGYNLYKGFNLNFFRLLPGENELEITGDGTMTMSGRFLHNVGA